MKIPTSFKLYGRTIKVKYDNNLQSSGGCDGVAKFENDTMILQPVVSGSSTTKELLEQTFLHEVVHFVLLAAEEEDIKLPLYTNEYFVERVSNLLHQVITTAKYKK